MILSQEPGKFNKLDDNIQIEVKYLDMGFPVPMSSSVRMEDSGIRMIRRFSAYAVLMLMLLMLFSGTAGAEEAFPATPTDLSCAHEHTRTTIYFFDSPVYTSVSPASHRVSGPAEIRTDCLDCGKTLSSRTADHAEEIRSHSMKKGVCALCGYREKRQAQETAPADKPGERTLYASKDDTARGLMSLTLSGEELAELEEAHIDTVLVRGETGTAAIVLDVSDALTQARETDTDLCLEFSEREDGSFFADVSLVPESGVQTEPDDLGISLRFYRDSRSDVRVSLAPSDTDTLEQAEGVWDEHGYWSVRYLTEGTYFVLQ